MSTERVSKNSVTFAYVHKARSTESVRARRRENPCNRKKQIRQLSMGAGVEQRPWTPTVRRGKICAEFSGPGPASVQLPDLVGAKVQADSKKQTAPAFTFGQKHLLKYESIGPGPAQYNVAGLGAKGTYNPPALSLRSRQKERGSFKTPAPGEYDVDKAMKAVVDAAPRYTFGYRPNLDRFNNTPAPNVYRIPPILGSSKDGTIKSAPAFSMTSRQKGRVGYNVFYPGPGQYDAEYKNIAKRPPIYSMGIKHKPITDDTMKPGPGAHCPEKLMYRKKSTPAPSFSIRHSQYAGERQFHLIPWALDQKLGEKDLIREMEAPNMCC